MTLTNTISGALTPGLLVSVLSADKDVLVVTDDIGRIGWASPSVEHTLGWDVERFLHVGAHLVHPGDQQAMDAALTSARVTTGTTEAGEIRLLAADGDYVPLDVTILNLLDEHGVMVLRHRDLRHRPASLEHGPVVLDEVTGLPSRATVRRALEHRLARTTSSVAVLFCDLDGFKAVNDRFGHAAGDAVLEEVAVRLQKRLRDTELLGRWGGDEFVARVEVPGPALAATVAARLLSAVCDEPFVVDGIAIHLGLSIGVGLGQNGAPAGDVVCQADKAMYSAKRGGGGIVLAAA